MPKKSKGRFKSHKKEPTVHGDTSPAPSSVSSPSRISQSSTPSTTHLPTPTPSRSTSGIPLDANDYLLPLSPSPSVVRTSQGILEGAKDFKIKNSILTNIQGNAVVYKFDAGGPPSEEFMSVFTQHIEGSVTIQDLDRVQREMEKHALIQAIRDLPRANAAYNDYTSSDKRRVVCFKTTRQALLKETALCVTGTDGPRAYLLFGIAGVGKSTVAQTFAERADNLRLLGASFFFSRDEADRRSAEKFFTSIAFQLCAYNGRFAQAIGKVLTEAGVVAVTKDPQRQLEVLILEPLKPIIKSHPLPTVIVVDALDECDTEDSPSILMALNRLVQELPSFRVVLTTRPQPHLKFLLDRLDSHQVSRMEDIEAKIVDRDIQIYLRHGLSQEQVAARLPMLTKQWSVKDEELELLVQAAGQLFIIASTAVLFILDKVAYNPATQIKKLLSAFAQDHTPFKALNGFYTVILRSAVPLECDDDIVERYQSVIGSIVLLENALPIDALASLIDRDSTDICAVLVNLQSVISISSDDIPLVYHKSFPDYLMDAKRCTDRSLHIVPKDHHARLAICCLRIMNRHLKQNILGLGDPARYFDNYQALDEEGRPENDIQQAIPPELQYAVAHWANHIKHVNPEDSALMEALKQFCEEHLLHWFEVLSWIRKLGVAHTSLDVVLKFRMPDSEMSQIFSDAVRFISRHYHRIEQSALYTYHSALPFSPTESLLYKTFKMEMLNNLCQVEGGPMHWEALIATPQHGGRYCFVTFSADGSQLASWDDEEAMKVWNATTDTLVRAFNGGTAAISKDFSVVALSEGSSVAMYRVSSGAPITSFDLPATVVELALSFDGSRLAAGLKNGTVSIWDAANQELIASLDDYDPLVPLSILVLPCERHQLAFSPKGYMLAFTTSGGIDLWNGRVNARLEYESERPVGFVFLGDGTRIASIAEKDEIYTLRLWNGKNGDFIGVVRNVGHVLAISADGSLLATGGRWKEVQLWSGDVMSLVDTIPIMKIASLAFSGDILAFASLENVMLYDVKSRASIATLQISLPISVAFSPDGTRLAAGDKYGAVHLWDVQTLKASAPTSERQQSPVSSLAFSPDCSRLACGFKDGSIELWDTVRSRKTVARHKLHSSEVTTFAFSPDGNELASGAGDVRFWNGRDGTPTGTILEYTSLSWIFSMAFSSSLLAVGGNVIAVWDRESRHFVHTLSQNCNSLAFSLDGSILAFATNNGVMVWDTKKHTTINTDSHVRDLFLSPDGLMFARRTSDALNVFGIRTCEKPIKDLEYKDFSWLPHLNGIPISREWDPERWGRLIGWFSARHDKVPVLWIPRDFSVSRLDGRPSIFALGMEDGRIIFITPTTKTTALV